MIKSRLLKTILLRKVTLVNTKLGVAIHNVNVNKFHQFHKLWGKWYLCLEEVVVVISLVKMLYKMITQIRNIFNGFKRIKTVL